jgi:phage FluMu protein Com
MPKRKFIAEAEADDNGYTEAECPECGAIVTARFQRGRKWRRLQCPICRSNVTVSIKEEETPLIQLRHAGAE